MAYPQVINFDGTTYPALQQGAYWPGFRVRLVDNVGAPVTTTAPLAQIRTAAVDKGGVLKATLRHVDEGLGWWHFDLLTAATELLPIQTLFFDAHLTDPAGQERIPIVGKIKVIGEVSR